MLRIGVIMGGDSSERDISLLSGHEFLKNLNPDKYIPVSVLIAHPKDILKFADQIDFALIALHGKNGEDGKVQALLEALEIPYSGSGVTSSALCMDKEMSKIVMRSMGVQTPNWITLQKSQIQDLAQTIEKVRHQVTFPVIIKPNQGGSSIGISIIEEIASTEQMNKFQEALERAFEFDERVLIEEFITGTEITCSLLKGEVIPVLKITPNLNFFDFDSKYKEVTQDYMAPVVDFSGEKMAEVHHVAKLCWDIFKLKSYARVDMMINEEKIYVIEINTLPGMTAYSLLPKSVVVGGFSFTEVLDKIIQDAMADQDAK